MSKFNQNEVENYLLVEGINSKGYGILSQIVMRDKRLPIEAKGIYAYIISFAGAGSSAFPSIVRMCNELNIGENRFYKYRKFLVELNYLEIVPQRKENKRYNNIYKIINNPKPIEKSLPLQIEGIEKQHPQIEGIEIEGIQNEGTIINSSLKLSVPTNNICTEEEDKKVALSEKMNEVEIEILIDNLKEKYKTAFTKRKLNSIIDKCLVKYVKGKIEKSLENYVEGALIQEKNKAIDKKEKTELKKQALQEKTNFIASELPNVYYNWLEEEVK